MPKSRNEESAYNRLRSIRQERDRFLCKTRTVSNGNSPAQRSPAHDEQNTIVFVQDGLLVQSLPDVGGDLFVLQIRTGFIGCRLCRTRSATSPSTRQHSVRPTLRSACCFSM